MQDPQDINQALIVAAHAHNISAYGQAAREAISYARSNPDHINELSPGIHLNTLTPDFAGHAASLSYGVATNNHAHTAISTASALISALCLQQNRTENQDISGLTARVLSFVTFGIPLVLTVGEAALTHSWQRVIPAFLSAGIGAIPYIREQSIIEQRDLLIKRLNDINDDVSRFRHIMHSFNSLRNAPLIHSDNLPLLHNLLLLQTTPTQLSSPAA
jgi:hypothetical protein